MVGADEQHKLCLHGLMHLLWLSRLGLTLHPGDDKCGSAVDAIVTFYDHRSLFELLRARQIAGIVRLCFIHSMKAFCTCISRIKDWGTTIEAPDILEITT